jgi:hypothetical protein
VNTWNQLVSLRVVQIHARPHPNSIPSYFYKQYPQYCIHSAGSFTLPSTAYLRAQKDLSDTSQTEKETWNILEANRSFPLAAIKHFLATAYLGILQMSLLKRNTERLGINTSF